MGELSDEDDAGSEASDADEAGAQHHTAAMPGIPGLPIPK